MICKNKDFLNVDKAKLEKCLDTDFYSLGREWPYKNVKRRIIVKKYVEEKTGSELKDYKNFFQWCS